jgi:hypothetical protein
MNIANFFVCMLLSYYLLYFITFFSKNTRDDIKKRNRKLTKLRTKAVKSLEEQKSFLNAKYPKKKDRWWWSFLRIFIFIILSIGFNYLFKYLNINLVLWHAIAIVILTPIVINWVLHSFDLETKEDISIFFR